VTPVFAEEEDRELPQQDGIHLHGPCGDLRATGGLRVGPLATTSSRCQRSRVSGCTKNRESFVRGDQPVEAGKQRSIRWSQSRAGRLPTKDGNLVAEHDYLDGQIGVVGPL
jgi:hypothetical protein